MRYFSLRIRDLACALVGFASLALTAPTLADHPVHISVPKGFHVELVAKAPLVEHPMMGCFDDRGRLFLAESAGRNLNEIQLDELRPNSIRMLEDLDGDGVFDRFTVFADKLAIPNGVLWLNGALYVAEPPGIWRFTDTDDDGVADMREHIAGNVRSNGMSSTLHGPMLHPSGRLFWCGGQMGYSLDRNEQPPQDRSAPGVFSLLPDGTEHEVFAVGGTANPVEVAFSDTGDVFGTVAILDFHEGARHDALMHWVYGGLYPSRENVPPQIYQTGPRLPPLSHVGQVAPAGIARYGSDQFGVAFEDNLFWAQFNTHTVVRTKLERDGASYTAIDQDFATCESVDFHPTDVLEDADGSLLIIDTGGWFRHGCPTSRIARPEALGAIYRVRRDGAHQVIDPRGKQFDWPSLTIEFLIGLLNDQRPAVVERAMTELADRPAALAALTRALEQAPRSTVRLNCVWSLSRRQSLDACNAIVLALDDEAATIRQAAANALGLARHHGAIDALLSAVAKDDSLAVRREAALAISRIGNVDRVAPLIAALDASSDSFYQHALIDALIRSGQTAPLVEALANDSAAIRRGAMLALNHLEKTSIPAEQIAPMLVDHDIALREAAFDIAGHHEHLSGMIVEAIPELLTDRKLVGDVEQSASLRKTLLALAGRPSVHAAIATTFASPSTGQEAKLLLMSVMRLADMKSFPAAWMSAIEHSLTADDEQLQQAALEVASAHHIPELDNLLLGAARNEGLAVSLRVACLENVAAKLDPPPSDLFSFALNQLNASADSIQRAAAARTIAAMKLSTTQLEKVAGLVTRADALILAPLLNAFGREPTAEAGELLLEAISRRTSLEALPQEQLSGLIRRFPREIQDRAKPVLNQLGVDLEEQEKRMEQLMELVSGGDVLRGKQVFFGKKASCSACHRVKGQGALIGPNLSTIAAIRSPRDLLESIVFPSASIVQDYHPVVVATSDGRVISGLEIRRSDQEIWLQQSDLKEVRLRIDDIEEIRESAVSIMPQGLEQKLTQEELRDLIGFLRDLKPSPSYLLDTE